MSKKKFSGETNKILSVCLIFSSWKFDFLIIYSNVFNRISKEIDQTDSKS